MTDLITCHKCGAPMGEIITIRGLEVLKVGNVITANLPGTCYVCGAEFYFSANGRRFNKIVKKWREETKPVIY